MDKSNNGNRDAIASPNSERERRSGKNRRKGPLFLAYYLAGGIEKRIQTERRGIKPSVLRKRFRLKKRNLADRRKVVNTKYLNCGKVMDQRVAARRSDDRVDPSAVTREKYNRLGPGWID